MDGLALIAGLMGLAGLPHCVAMCAAPCAAVAGRGAAALPLFHLARVAGYAAAGALAAASVGALREALAQAPLLRPLWTLLHAAALAVGLWMLWRGRWPALAQRSTGPMTDGWQRVALPLRATVAGAMWIAWPCALSQAGLLVAALAATPAQGAAVMAAFALASSPALWLGPMLLRRGLGPTTARVASWPMRLAGAALALGSGWALSRGLWTTFAAWCGWA